MKKAVLVLSIFGAAADFVDGVQPEKIPYFCELSANYDNCSIVTNGLIYIKKPNENGFNGWDLARFEIDTIANSDSFELSKTQGNKQGFEFSSDKLEDEREQLLADLLEFSAENLNKAIVNIEFPNGKIDLMGF